MVFNAEQKLEIVFLVGSNAAAILPAVCALFKKVRPQNFSPLRHLLIDH